jgi:hypothetical protein
MASSWSVHESFSFTLKRNKSTLSPQTRPAIPHGIFMPVNPLLNPTLCNLVVIRGNILGQWTGPWSTKSKVRGIVPKAARHRSDDNGVTDHPFGAPGSTPLYVWLPPPIRLCWWWLFNSPVFVVLLWTTGNLHEKMAKPLVEFKFCHLGKKFYGTKWLWWDSVM